MTDRAHGTGPDAPPSWLTELSAVGAPARGPRRWSRVLRRASGWPARAGRAVRRAGHRAATRYRRPAAVAGAFAAVLALIVGAAAVGVPRPVQSTVASTLVGSGATSDAGPASVVPPTVPAATPTADRSPAGPGGRLRVAGPSASPGPTPPPGTGSGSGAGGSGSGAGDSGTGDPPPEPEPTRTSATIGGPGWSAVVDDSSGRFRASSEWSTASAGRQRGSTHHRSTPVLRSDPAWYRFDIPATGRYRVEVWFPASSQHNDRTPYIVVTTDGHQPVHIDQQGNGGQWVSLGEFEIAAGDADVVAVSRWREDGGYVVADAVRVTRL